MVSRTFIQRIIEFFTEFFCYIFLDVEVSIVIKIYQKNATIVISYFN